jgi:molybdopterin synthase catalytic subunit
MAQISVQAEDFDLGAEVKRLRGDRTDVGAIVTFSGTVRDLDGTLSTMTLEHYPGMTEAELERIAQEAESRWPLQGTRIIHRYGPLEPGDNIVLVITLSKHRQASFDAAMFLMDFLKSRAPFWKKEQTGKASEWVDARETDKKALDRWTKTDQ